MKKSLLPANYLTVAQAAKRLGMTKYAIHKALTRDKVPGAAKLGTVWVIDIDQFQPAIMGRPVSKGRRCPCGKNTETRAKLRAYDCCKKAGVMEPWR